MAKKQSTPSYEVTDIQVLEGLEAVRRRPGMYIGSTDIRGLHHLVQEVVDNSVDEALAGVCDRIEITLNPDNSVTVVDNGRGIPVGPHPTQKKPNGEPMDALEVVHTILHAGGKFGGSGYKVASGLHGVGVSAVNALSEWLEVQVRRDGKVYRQRYEQGRPVTPVEIVGKSKPKDTGTHTTFRPDLTILKTLDFKFDVLMQRFREMAFLTHGLTLRFVDNRPVRGKPAHREMSFYFEGGIAAFVRYLNKNRGVLHPPVYVEKQVNGTMVEAAIQYTDGYAESMFAFANNINTVDGGTHLTGFRSALTRCLNDYARSKSLLKDKDSNFSGEDTRQGLTAVLSVKLTDPQFESQTKGKLGNAELRGQVESVVAEALSEFLDKNTSQARKIVQKCLTSSRAREAARKARDLVIRKSALESMTLPGKLADCSERDATKTEIFIVEGDSAGGCFSGDTLVALADGRALSFEELVQEQAAGREHFCYTIRRDGQIGLERIVHARRTKTNVEVVRVTLDDGESVTCTPDHLFMLRDGSYKPAASLAPGDSLMPLRRKLSDIRDPQITIDGYEMVWDPRSERWLFTHILADWYNRWQGVYVVEKCRTIHQSQDFRAKMSERMRQPETRQLLSERAKTQWEDEEYKRYMLDKWREFHASNAEYRQQNREQLDQVQREYWSDEENRRIQAERVRAFFAEHPKAREALSLQAREQWQDEQLLAWRREKTRQQWTPEFRAKRRAALHRTYYRKTLAVLKQFEIEQGELDLEAYRAYRIETQDKSLRFDTFCTRYFDGDETLACEAVANYNHRITSVEHLARRLDVYDIEVPNTHNFALASGVFVHNSAKQGRDRRFQAILPLRGKIINVEKARLDRILSNKEIQAIITALGTGIGAQFSLDGLRYGRVTIMTDADVDGSHIRTLLLTFFFRYMEPLIEDGHLFIAQPPLYRINAGREHYYVYTEEEREAMLRKLQGKSYTLQRYKGLGEMNPEQLWETTMNPEKRTLLQVTIEDAAAADRTFDMLMGSSVPPRKRFIQTHAKNVRNLDV